MESGPRKKLSAWFSAALGLIGAVALGQQPSVPLEVPPNFKLDFETAARLRPQLMAQSVPAAAHFSTGRLVFERLVRFVDAPSGLNPDWQVRIVNDDEFNAYSSPDGSVYVESGLAKLAGSSTGLWAALLSHEIAHVVRRDWARRYLYQRSLERNGSGSVALGETSSSPGGWTDPVKASADLGRFARELELEADREGLMLMGRAGYHPDFVPALHHLLHAQSPRVKTRSLNALHPCWEERDQQLNQAYTLASMEFARRWPEWYASPGGNPPVVVFAAQPTVRKNSATQWQIQVPMRCQNLAGAVEVVLRSSAPRAQSDFSDDAADPEARQISGCTSPVTTVTFIFDQAQRLKKVTWDDVYVLDAWGAVLARADVPKQPR